MNEQNADKVAAAVRRGQSAAESNKQLAGILCSIAIIAAIVIGVRYNSWALGGIALVALVGSIYLPGALATVAALVFGMGCGWVGYTLGIAFGGQSAALVCATIGFVIGAGAHYGAQQHGRDIADTMHD